MATTQIFHPVCTDTSVVATLLYAPLTALYAQGTTIVEWVEIIFQPE